MTWDIIVNTNFKYQVMEGPLRGTVIVWVAVWSAVLKRTMIHILVQWEIYNLLTMPAMAVEEKVKSSVLYICLPNFEGTEHIFW